MKIIFLTACLFLLTLSAFSQSDSTFFDNRARVESWIQKHNVPALGIAVIRAGKIRELRMYGEIQKGMAAPYNAIFNVASLTKPVVSVLTYKLVNAGAWDLDEPLPEVGSFFKTLSQSKEGLVIFMNGIKPS